MCIRLSQKWQWTHILGSSIVTAVSWAKVSCSTSSSFSPSPSPLSATLELIPPTGCASWLATTPDLRSLCFCRNLTSSNVNLFQFKNIHIKIVECERKFSNYDNILISKTSYTPGFRYKKKTVRKRNPNWWLLNQLLSYLTSSSSSGCTSRSGTWRLRNCFLLTPMLASQNWPEIQTRNESLFLTFRIMIPLHCRHNYS